MMSNAFPLSIGLRRGHDEVVRPGDVADAGSYLRVDHFKEDGYVSVLVPKNNVDVVVESRDHEEVSGAPPSAPPLNRTLIAVSSGWMASAKKKPPSGHP